MRKLGPPVTVRIHPAVAPRDLPALFDALPLPVLAIDRHGRVAVATAAWVALDPAVTPGEEASGALSRAFPCAPPAAVGELLAGSRETFACPDMAAPDGTGPARLVRTAFPADSPFAALLTLQPVPGDDRYRRLVDEANDIMFGLDRQGRFTHVNRLGYAVSGYTPEELIGRAAVDFVPPEHVPRVAASLAAVWRGESVPLLEVEFQFKDGRRRWFEVKGRTLLEDGVVIGTFHVARDITERRALAQARELLSRAAAAAPIVLWVIDMEGRYTLLEGGALQKYGLQPGELVGRSIFDYLREAPEVLAEVRRGLAGEAFTSTGTWRDTTFEVHYVPLRDPDGVQVGLLGVVLDITERIRAEEARARADKMEALAILAGGVAHDFNNLLVGILGNASLTLLELPPGSPARPSLLEIESAARRLADLARQLLAFSGRSHIARQPVDLRAVVNAAIDSLGQATAVHLELAPALPPVHGDPGQLRLAIAALIENAAEASPPGAPVTIAVRPVRMESGQVAWTYPAPLPLGEYVAIEVRDRGEGIAPDHFDRIFDPFYTTRFPGRGLGLAAAAGIARAHRGAIAVDSAPGRGSTFTVFLPVAEPTS